MSKETDAVKCQLALTIVDIVWTKGLITDDERIKVKTAYLNNLKRRERIENSDFRSSSPLIPAKCIRAIYSPLAFSPFCI